MQPPPQPDTLASTSRRALILGRWRVPFFYGWVIVGVCFIADFMAAGLGGATISLFFRPMMDSQGWSLTSLVGAVTAASLLSVAVSPFMGRIIDRFGSKPVMLWGALVAAAGMFAMTRIDQVWQFWLLFACVSSLGLGELGQLTTSSAVAQWFSRRRGRALALSGVGNTTGIAVLAPVVAFSIAWVGWRETWLLMGILLLLVMIPIILVFMRSRPENIGVGPDGEPLSLPAEGAAAPATVAGEWTVREAFRTRSLWILLLAFVLGSAFNAVFTLVVPFFVEQEGMPNTSAGWIISAYFGSSIFARLFWGFMLERWQARYCMALAFLSRAITPALMIVIPYPLNIGAFLFFGGFIGGAMGVLQPVTWSNYFGRKAFASIQGTIRPFLAIPQFALPLLLALMFDRLGNFNVGFMLLSVLTLLGAGVALLSTPPVRPAEAIAVSSS